MSESLKDRLAALRKSLAPAGFNTAPTPKRGSSKKVEEPVPDVSELDLSPVDYQHLRELVVQHTDFGRQEREAKKAKEPLSESIKEICNRYTVRKVMCWGRKLTYYPMSRPTISAHLLLAAGVSPQTIKDCTTTTTSWAVRVTEPGDEEDES